MGEAEPVYAESEAEGGAVFAVRVCHPANRQGAVPDVSRTIYSRGKQWRPSACVDRVAMMSPRRDLPKIAAHN